MKPKLLPLLTLLLCVGAVSAAHAQEDASYEATYRASSQRAVALYPDISVSGTDMYRLMGELDKKLAANHNPLHANAEKPFLMATLASRFVTRKKAGWSTRRNSEKLWAEVKALNQSAAAEAAATTGGETGAGGEEASFRTYMAEIRKGLTLRNSPLLQWPGRESIIADLAEAFHLREQGGMGGEENSRRLTEEVERYERVVRARQGEPAPDAATAMPLLPQLTRPGTPGPARSEPAGGTPSAPAPNPAMPRPPRPVLPLPVP